jgi:hypothetical protein
MSETYEDPTNLFLSRFDALPCTMIYGPFDGDSCFCEVTYGDVLFSFKHTLYYVEIKMADRVFLWGDLEYISASIIDHYAKAFLRSILLFHRVHVYNNESKIGKITFSLTRDNFLHYNLPSISMDINPKEKEIGCNLVSYLISEKYWIPPSNEGYPLRSNPYSAGDIYYLTSSGMTPLPRDFFTSCDILVEKMLQM